MPIHRFQALRRTALIALGVLILALLAACGGDDEPTAAPAATATTAPSGGGSQAAPTATPTRTSSGGSTTAAPTATIPVDPALAERQAKLTAGLVYRELDADWDSSAPEIQRLIPLAEAEGKVLVTTYGDATAQAWCGAFEAEFPAIDCEGRGIGAAQITAALVTEREAGQRGTDVASLAMSHTAQLDDRGMFVEIDWAALGVDAGRVWDANAEFPGNAIGIYQNQYTHFVNTDLIDLEDLPKDMFGFNDPQWKGLMCANAFLFRAGQGFTGIYYDIEPVVEWGQDLINDQDLIVTSSCDPLLLSGERPIYVFGYGNPPTLLENPNIEQFWNPGMGVNLFSIGVIDGGPNPNAGRLFAAWVSGKEGSQAQWDCCGSGWPAYGHASAGITTGSFAAQMVYESIETFRDRIKWQTQFSQEVFPGAQ